MLEYLQDLKSGGRPMTKLELANKEIERLKSIIKEAVEFIKENKDKYYQDWGEDDGSYDTYLGEYEIDKVLEILDKVGSDNV